MLFNRQQTQASLFPDIKKIKGERETEEIYQIPKIQWDCVVDLSCFYPNSLSSVLSHLKSCIGKYIFISTCSIYDNENNHSQLRNETAKTLDCTLQQRTDGTPDTYGNRKAECERVLKDSEQDHIILRPALVYGAHDHTDRLYYWLHQLKHHNTLLLPDKGERVFSMTYVKDLVETIIHAFSANGNNQIYNMISPPKASIRLIVDCAGELMKREITEINAKADFLKKNDIDQWTDMPLWLDADYFTYSNQKLKTQFNWEPTNLKTAIAETIAYCVKQGWQKPKNGMPEERRQELIENLYSNEHS